MDVCMYRSDFIYKMPGACRSWPGSLGVVMVGDSIVL